ncbi:anaerobic sulfite reductase subunit AsrA [Mollicutes bacterium LVI A0039]|nr:anaerobic sulfite reductase subunit AsrA [Mollicutes bacterium LVI A0039]
MKLSYNQFVSNINTLNKDFRFFGPVRHEKRGRYSDTDLVYYEVVDDFNQLDFSVKSDFSAKEIATPLNQTLFHFANGELIEADYDNRPVIVFLRSCDLHAFKRLDEIYLNNKYLDNYYARLRSLLSFAVIGCSSEFDSCFCTTFGTNKTDDYHIGINLGVDEVSVDVKDERFNVFGENSENFVLDHVLENKNKVTLPKLVELSQVIDSDIWEEYNTRCIGCGACNFVCPTCSCFTTQDISYDEQNTKGERKRVMASCMVDGFSDMAGGHTFREKKGERMRFKLMHKVNDFNKRFGYDMCVGCGRCDDVCPELISFSNQINKLSNEVGGRDE